MHLVLIVWTVGLLAPVDVPAFVKFAIVLTGTTVMATITYHYFVRSTAVGALLNGRRYPRALPVPTPAETAARIG